MFSELLIIQSIKAYFNTRPIGIICHSMYESFLLSGVLGNELDNKEASSGHRRVVHGPY